LLDKFLWVDFRLCRQQWLHRVFFIFACLVIVVLIVCCIFASRSIKPENMSDGETKKLLSILGHNMIELTSIEK
jgi:hypothetical protein